MSNWTVKRDGRKYRAVFEFDADECEAVAYAFGPRDGAFDEFLAAAEQLRDFTDEGNDR